MIGLEPRPRRKGKSRSVVDHIHAQARSERPKRSFVRENLQVPTQECYVYDNPLFLYLWPEKCFSIIFYFKLLQTASSSTIKGIPLNAKPVF